jgi:hypothetical protein
LNIRGPSGTLHDIVRRRPSRSCTVFKKAHTRALRTPAGIEVAPAGRVAYSLNWIASLSSAVTLILTRPRKPPSRCIAHTNRSLLEFGELVRSRSRTPS